MSSPGQNIRYVASNTEVNDCTRYIRSRVPILCQMNGSQALPSYFFTPRFNTVLTSTQISFKLCISFRFPLLKLPTHASFLPTPLDATRTAHFILDFDIQRTVPCDIFL